MKTKEKRQKRAKFNDEHLHRAKPQLTWRNIWLQRELIIMSVPLLLYIIFFRYFPITGWAMAFQNYKPAIRNVWDQEWVGLTNFQNLLNNNTLYGQMFLRSVRNTFAQSLLSMALGFVCAIGLSLLLNEVRNRGFKRIIQNISYMPHFLSWIIATGMIATALSLPQSGGFINIVLYEWLGILKEPIQFLNHPQYFWGIVAGGQLWKSLGWNTIIYLAAMTAIDPQLYEAAEIDGANRWRKMWHITLPSIKATIVILLIMSTGYMLESGFEIQYFLGGSVNKEMAENIDIFVLRYGIQVRSQFHIGTVAGIMKTIVAIFFVSAANWLAKVLGSERLV
ncbi:MAG: ABC transporter permease subunit [Lachnospiraceae bacterium]|nr:ABC transporter permease subunit [Lachnospiraceae bacterium]